MTPIETEGRTIRFLERRLIGYQEKLINYIDGIEGKVKEEEFEERE